MLTILAEECAEVQKAICKALRHGLDSVNPSTLDSDSNRQEIEHKMGDVLALSDILIGNGTLSMTNIGYWRNSKPQRMKPYLHERRDSGTAQEEKR
jgi:NTP pyrophosphatase (non-canonical NTP hydrolase)